MRDRFLYIILSVTCLFSVSATAQKDSKAKDILDKSSASFSKAGDMTVYFTMNIKDPASKVTESFDGEIRMKGNKFYLSTPDAEIWFDGKTQWSYMKGYQEVNISAPSADEAQAVNPASIFNIYKRGCNYKYISEKTDQKNRKVYEVELLPQKGDMKRIVLQINKADLIPVFFKIDYKNKIENLIYINKYQTQQNHPEYLFTFDKKKYPGAELNDLR